MAITRFKDSSDSNREYYRITRAWGGVEHQRYVRIKRSERAAFLKAQVIDQQLEERQRAYRLRQELPSVRMVDQRGKIRGLARVTNKRPGRNQTEEFKLRVRHPETQDLHFTSISISHHGFEAAFQLAIEQILSWCEWENQPEIRQRLLACREFYRDSNQDDPPAVPAPRHQDELSAFEAGLQLAVRAYMPQRQIIQNRK